MTIVAQEYPFVIGVDTHAKNHAFAILAAGTGAVVDQGQFPSTAAGMARAIDWAARRTGGDLAALWVVEGVASYGALLAGRLAAAGYQVVEAARMDARARRGVGKSDPLDARRIAAAVLPLELAKLRHPRADQGIRAALRVLTTARDQMSTTRTAAINALTALVRVVDLGVDARTPLTGTQITQITSWRARPAEQIATATARAEAIRLAKQITSLDADLAANKSRMEQLVRASPAAPLLDQTGIGPVTAAIAFTAWSHPGRVRSEAAFAALAGVNPIPASSGNTVRHRLNHGGDRRLNRALHMVVVTRMAHDPDTRAYAEKRRAEGRTNREIRRCLKRYLARHIYRTLNTTAAMTQLTPDPTCET
jgi:transposase